MVLSSDASSDALSVVSSARGVSPATAFICAVLSAASSDASSTALRPPHSSSARSYIIMTKHMLMLCYAKSNHPQDIITMLSFISAVGV